TFGSNKKVWWRGACGHEWQTNVKGRSNGEKCPICSGARVIAGINDLATLEPQLVYVGIRWYVKGWRETRGYH
ncbi:zinc-ribbon domain-containing protein, partial [[Ruminococcus] torques]|uniref:zinc-ribbon domain-containing protein n=1 Tax=[Ruminococcus] torques TaxID=33039 RepID=UPI001FAA7129